MGLKPCIKIVFLLTCVLFLLSVLACSRPTGYTKRSDWDSPYGYSDKRIGDDEFSIAVTGNAITSAERVAQIALLRAAYLTQEQGRTHFCIFKAALKTLDAEQSITFPVVIAGIAVPVPIKTKANKEPTAILLIRILPIQASYPPDALAASEIIASISK